MHTETPEPRSSKRVDLNLDILELPCALRSSVTAALNQSLLQKKKPPVEHEYIVESYTTVSCKTAVKHGSCINSPSAIMELKRS